MPRFLSLIFLITLLVLIITGCNRTNAGELNVLVQNADFEPVTGAKVVSNKQPDGQLKVTGITNANGNVIFKGIRAGVYEFYVSYHEQQEFTVRVKSNRSTRITVIMNSP